MIKLSGWNYRVIRSCHRDEFVYAIHEVYYDENDVPTSWSSDSIAAHGGDMPELLADMQRMSACFMKDVLEIHDGKLRVCTDVHGDAKVPMTVEWTDNK